MSTTKTAPRSTTTRTKPRIYPEFHIHAQETGRWSTVEPPLAQLPKDLRDIIVPDVGEAWVAWDWSGIEEVMMGALTGEPAILEPLARGEDLHERQALLMFGEVARGKAEPHRTFTKRFKYRLYYGGEPKSCGDIPGAKQLGLTDGRKLTALANRFLAGLPHYMRWRRQVEHELRGNPRPESRDFVGRCRRLLSSKGRAVLREAWNNPLQMGVASVLNLTLVAIKKAAPWSSMVYTMHDAATLACPAERAEELVEIAKPIVMRAWPITDQYGVERDIVFRADFYPIRYGA